MANLETAPQSQSILETGRFPEQTLLLAYFGLDVAALRLRLPVVAEQYPDLQEQVDTIVAAAEEGQPFAQKFVDRSKKMAGL